MTTVNELEALISAAENLDDDGVVGIRETNFGSFPVFGGPDPNLRWEQWRHRYYRRLSMDPTEPEHLRALWADDTGRA